MDPPPDACPLGHDASEPPTLAWDGGRSDALWARIESCRTCAREYLASLWTAAAMRSAAAPVAVARPRRGPVAAERVLWAGWKAAAAVIVVAVATGFAVGGLVPWFRVHFLGSSHRGGAELYAARGFELAEAGIPEFAALRAEVGFEVGAAELGTALCFELPQQTGLIACAFDARGSALWSSASDWGATGELLRRPEVQSGSFRPFLSPTAESDLEDLVLLVARRKRRTLVACVDPAVGRVRWSVLCDGEFAHEAYTKEPVVTLPSQGRTPRAVLLPGSNGHGVRSVPVLLVIGGDGRPVQALQLPVFARGALRETHASVVRVDWRADPLRATVQTSEGVHFRFEVRAGRLDPATVLVSASDEFEQRQAERLTAEGAARRFAELGGPDGWRERLGREVVEIEFPTRRDW
jgi:hypothetical protein